MAGITTGKSYSSGEQVTAASLNLQITGAKLNSDAVDGTKVTVTSAGQLNVGVIDAANIGANAVTTDKILNSNVTKAKIENIADDRVLGNTSGGAAAPSEIALTTVSAAGFTPTTYNTEESIKLPNGLLIKHGRVSVSGTTHTHTFVTSGETAFGTVFTAIVSGEGSGALDCSVGSFSTTQLIANFHDDVTHLNYFVIGKIA
tara:strand:- start:1279 stop:1884 length:606 start_codon:yes stop_codon:yes gene_type:complete